MDINLDIKKDFWKLNPLALEVPLFKEFQEKHKDSSIMMWHIFLGKHPDGIIFKAYDTDNDRNEAINKGLFEKKSELINFNDDYYKLLIRTFEKIFIPTHRLALIKMEKFIKEFLYEIEDMPMSEKKVKLMKGYKEIVPMLETAKKLFEEGEKTLTTLKDGSSLTAAQSPMSFFEESDFE